MVVTKVICIDAPIVLDSRRHEHPLALARGLKRTVVIPGTGAGARVIVDR